MRLEWIGQWRRRGSLHFRWSQQMNRIAFKILQRRQLFQYLTAAGQTVRFFDDHSFCLRNQG